MGVGIVSKDLVKIFGDEITVNDEISFSNPKDNLSTRCSDNIVLFNLAIYLYIEKNTETQQIPFKILNNDMYTNILLGYSDAQKPIDNLLTIWHNLKEECTHSIPLSTECLYSFLFYCHTSNSYKQLNSHIQSYKELFAAVSSLIQKNTVASLQACYPPKLFANLCLTLLAPFSDGHLQDAENISMYITKARNELKNQKGIFFKEIAQYQSIYNDLITEYVRLAPAIVKQMEFEGASNEVATIDNELYEWANELLDLLENNNVSRFLSLINTYNHKKIDDCIILIIFNLLFLDNTTSDCLITIFEQKKKYNTSPFHTDELLTNNTLSILKDFLNRCIISYKHLDLLTFIDYNTLVQKEWDFLLNLPAEQEFEQQFLSSFLQIIIAYRGTEAFTNVNDIYIPIHVIRERKVFYTTVSAGTGSFLDGEDYEMYSSPDITEEAAFGVHISGDSMEPRYHNEELVWIEQTEQLDDGEIGIFYLDGNAYIKRFQNNRKGTYHISLV